MYRKRGKCCDIRLEAQISFVFHHQRQKQQQQHTTHKFQGKHVSCHKNVTIFIWIRLLLLFQHILTKSVSRSSILPSSNNTTKTCSIELTFDVTLSSYCRSFFLHRIETTCLRKRKQRLYTQKSCAVTLPRCDTKLKLTRNQHRTTSRICHVRNVSLHWHCIKHSI